MKPASMPPDEGENLLRLLALKRHELPPPGYFHFFPGKVIARIEAQGIMPRQSWWEQWLGTWMARPMVATLGGLLLGGAMMSVAGPDESLAGNDAVLAESRLEPGVAAPARPLSVATISRPLRVTPIDNWRGAPSVTPLVEQSSAFARGVLTTGDIRPASYTPLR